MTSLTRVSLGVDPMAGNRRIPERPGTGGNRGAKVLVVEDEQDVAGDEIRQPAHHDDWPRRGGPSWRDHALWSTVPRLPSGVTMIAAIYTPTGVRNERRWTNGSNGHDKAERDRDATLPQIRKYGTTDRLVTPRQEVVELGARTPDPKTARATSS
jgi:hypothetical protein